MDIRSIDLVWIAVANMEAAIDFYTKTLGFELKERADEYGWAELAGSKGGTRLGIMQASDQDPMKHKPGSNAVPTITVGDIVAARAELAKKGVTLIGEIMDCPGVKLQSFADNSGNLFQLVEITEAH